MLFQVITEREERASIGCASNAPFSDWYQLFPNPVVAESVLDRLVNSSHHIFMEGKSYRPNKRPGRKPAKTKGGAAD